jgi:hypothetical protein
MEKPVSAYLSGSIFETMVVTSFVGSCGEEILHIGELPLTLGFPCPVEFGEDEVLLADDPDGLPHDLDSLAAIELNETVVLAFADHEIDFDQAVVVDDVEAGLMEN